MEEYHVKITVERGGESQCVNTTAKTAIYLSVLGFVLVASRMSDGRTSHCVSLSQSRR